MEIVAPGIRPIQVDLVFVHGLRGDRKATWTAANNVFWPSHLLPIDLPNARIMTWGYDSGIAHLKEYTSQNSIFGHADNLLIDICAERRSKEEKQRPIIFVGHSLGGLVIKQALIRASEKYHSSQDKIRGSIHPNTIGVVFLGTPHRGSDMSSIGEIVQGVAKMSLRQPNKHIMRNLSQESDVLEQQRQSFVSISQGFPIVCLFEELPTPGGMVVKEASACMDGFKVSRSSIPANHMDMCKFSGPDDLGYKRVSQFIGEFVDTATSVISLEGLQNGGYYSASSSSAGASELLSPRAGIKLIEGHSASSPRCKYKNLNRFSPPIRMTPPRMKRFIGRSKELMAIREQLGSPNHSGNDQLNACIVRGLGGVGKTEISIEYSWLYGNSYDAICWVYSNGRNKAEEDFRKLGPRLQKYSDVELDSLDAIHSILEVGDFSWLLILDEVWSLEDIAKVLPSRAAGFSSVIITTQASQMEINIPTRVVSVEPLDSLAAVSLLYSVFDDDDDSWQMTSPQQHQAAIEIVEKCHGLPLHIFVAGMSVHKTCTFVEYVQHHSMSTFSELSTRSAWSKYSGMGPARVFDRAIARLEGGSWALIGLLSFLDGEHIAQDMLLGQNTQRPPSLGFLHFGSFNLKDMRNVQAFSLVDKRITKLGSSFVMRKAVQQRVRAIMSFEDPSKGPLDPTVELRRKLGDFNSSYKRALDLLRSIFPRLELFESPISSRFTPEALQNSISHGLAFSRIVLQAGAGRYADFNLFAKLNIDLANLLWRRGDFEAGLRIVSEVEATLLDPEFSNLYDATLHAQIGLLRSRLTRDREGQPDLVPVEQALILSKRIEVPIASTENRDCHPILVASLLAEVGMVQLAARNIVEAHIKFKESIAELAILQKHEGKDTVHAATLGARIGLALCDLASGNTKEASERAMSVYSSIDRTTIINFGSHRIASSVADLLDAVGMKSEAIDLHKALYPIRLSFCGAGNPLTMESEQALAKI